MFRWGVAIGGVLLSFSVSAQQQLNVVSWDGAYVKSQILGFIRPYEKEAGIRVNVLQYSGGIDEIRRQVRSWNVHWDVVDLELFDAIKACEEGLLEKIDPAMLPSAPDGTPAQEDFISASLMPCGVGSVVASTVVGYDRERLKKAPQSIKDFFDLDKFPGRRGLRRTPQVNLEWALIADGVARDKVYQVLSTEVGVDRAFDVLTRIKPYIDWWETGQDAVRMLETGQVVMSSVFSGRIPAAVERGEPLEILWDHQVWVYDVWGIPKHSRDVDRAKDFIQFATSTRSLARQASYIPYGPVRRSSLKLIEPETRAQLPTAEQNMTTAIEMDAQWWSENQEELNLRFERWLQQSVMVPKDLPH